MPDREAAIARGQKSIQDVVGYIAQILDRLRQWPHARSPGWVEFRPQAETRLERCLASAREIANLHDPQAALDAATTLRSDVDEFKRFGSADMNSWADVDEFRGYSGMMLATVTLWLSAARVQFEKAINREN